MNSISVKFDHIEAMYKSAPMNASGSLARIDKLLDEIVADPVLQKDAIFKSNTMFSSDIVLNGTISLLDTEQKIADIATKFHSYLCDILIHVNQLELKKVENGSDFTNFDGFKKDINSIQQQLINIPFEIAEFHQKHDEDLKMKSQVKSAEEQKLQRKIILQGHKAYLVHQITDFINTMEYTRRLYRFLIKA